MKSLLSLVLFVQLTGEALAGSSNYYDSSVFGMSMQRDWMYESGSINMKYEGCVWGYVSDRENMGCMADESGDGTTYWYMMANCRRAQVAYSLYASSNTGGTSCKGGTWQESFVTKDGVSEFAYIMGTYGYDSPIGSDDASSLPVCESDGNGFYIATGCSTSGTFTIDRFTDAYCTQYYDTYDNLKNFNYKMRSLSSCYNVYSSRVDEDPSYSLANYIVADSGSCTENESQLCTTSNFVKNSGSKSGYGSRTTSRLTSGASASLTNKLKYGLGSGMLIGSVVMFFGILFTNRKKRRAMMHRKFRNSSKKRSSSSKTSKKRSSSKNKSSAPGVFA
jgi:hypothetical protein